MFGCQGNSGRMSHRRLICRHLLIFGGQNEYSVLVINKQADFTLVLCFIRPARQHLSGTLCKLRGSRAFLALHIFVQPKMRVSCVEAGAPSAKVLGEERPAWREGSSRRGQSWQGVQRRNGPHRVFLVRPVGARQSEPGGPAAPARGPGHALMLPWSLRAL